MSWFFSELGRLLLGIAPVQEFGNALGVSFGANVAYSVLTRFGAATGILIDKWIREERRKLTTTLAETRRFDYPHYSQQLSTLQTVYRKRVAVVNLVASTWAIIAAICDVLLLVLIPFYVNRPVPGIAVAEATFALFSAIPVGIIALLVLHAATRVRLRYLSSQFRTISDYAANAVSTRNASTREFLNKDSANPPEPDQSGQPQDESAPSSKQDRSKEPPEQGNSAPSPHKDETGDLSEQDK